MVRGTGNSSSADWSRERSVSRRDPSAEGVEEAPLFACRVEWSNRSRVESAGGELGKDRDQPYRLVANLGEKRPLRTMTRTVPEQIGDRRIGDRPIGFEAISLEQIHTD